MKHQGSPEHPGVTAYVAATATHTSIVKVATNKFTISVCTTKSHGPQL
jgi:hypothetical protein